VFVVAVAAGESASAEDADRVYFFEAFTDAEARRFHSENPRGMEAKALWWDDLLVTASCTSPRDAISWDSNGFLHVGDRQAVHAGVFAPWLPATRSNATISVAGSCTKTFLTGQLSPATVRRQARTVAAPFWSAP